MAHFLKGMDSCSGVDMAIFFYSNRYKSKLAK